MYKYIFSNNQLLIIVIMYVAITHTLYNTINRY